MKLTKEEKEHIIEDMQEIADNIAIATRVLSRCINSKGHTGIINNDEIAYTIEAFGLYASNYMMYELDLILPDCEDIEK